VESILGQLNTFLDVTPLPYVGRQGNIPLKVNGIQENFPQFQA